MDIKIRIAKKEDARALLNIYSYYIENTAITFEYKVPSVEEFEKRICITLESYPYLIAEVDGKISGYIYAGRFSPRAAYDWVAETSIYVDKDCHRMGLGRMLYQKLEEILASQNVTNIYAGIADLEDGLEEDPYLTKNSEHFHTAIGYKKIANFTKCGYKFNRWYNLIYMEKMIGEHNSPQKPLIPFSKL